MRKHTAVKKFILPVLLLISLSCVSYTVPPEVFVVNMYEGRVDFRLMQGSQQACVFENNVPGTVQPIKTLRAAGLYSVAWKTESLPSWHIQQQDPSFPDLTSGKYFFHPGIIYCMFADSRGIIRIIPVTDRPGYGARVCIFNAAAAGVSRFILQSPDAPVEPFLEIHDLPPNATTGFLPVVPGEMAPLFLPESGDLVPVNTAESLPAFSVSLKDGSRHLFLVTQKEKKMAVTHFLLSDSSE
ncbi:MAG: hypothetical protein JW904_05735 [Spirochaetales bacterium]|nr:hypothetical protein [Spirochaetales bacterium]